MARFDSMEDYTRTLERTIGVLDSTNRRLTGMASNIIGLDLAVKKGQESFTKMVYEMNAAGNAAKSILMIGQAFKGSAIEIVKTRNEMRDFQAMMDRMEVSAKALSVALAFRDLAGGGLKDFDLARVTQGLTDLSKFAGEAQTKVRGAFSGIASAISGSEVQVGHLKTTLSDFNRRVYDISRISTTLGRSGVLSENFWRGVDKNTSLGRLSFSNLYRDILENSKGLPMTEKQFASLAENIGQKFGGSVKTVDDRLRRFLNLQRLLPDMAERLEALKIGGAKGFEPRGLRETIALLGSLGATKRDLQMLAQYPEVIGKSEKSLMRFENALAKRNKAAENFNVKTAQSMEEGMISVENVMAKLTDQVTELSTVFGKLNGYIYMGVKGIEAFAAAAGPLSILTRVLAVAHGGGINKMATLATSAASAGTVYGGGAGIAATAGAAKMGRGIPLIAGAALAAGAIYTGAKYLGAASREREEEKKIENIGKYGEAAGEKDTASSEQELLRIRKEKRESGRKAIGMGTGAIVGGVIGSIVPGVGTVVGMGIGGYAGGAIAGMGGEKREKMYQVQNELQATLKDFGGDQTAELVGGVDGVKTIEDALIQVNKITNEENKKLAILSLQRGLNLTNVDLMSKADKIGNATLIAAVKATIELKKQGQEEKDKNSTALANYETMQKSLSILQIIVDKSKEWYSAMKGQGDMFKEIGLVGPMITKAYTSARQAADVELDAIGKKQRDTIQMWKKVKETPDTMKAVEGLTQDLSVKLELKDSDKNEFEKEMKKLSAIGKEVMEIKGDGTKELTADQTKRLSELGKERGDSEEKITAIAKENVSVYSDMKDILAGSLTFISTGKDDMLETATNAALMTAEVAKQSTLIERTRAMMSQYTGENEAAVNLLQKQNTLASAHADLIEKLALGMAPSYAARKRVYDLTVAERRQEEGKVERLKKMAAYEGIYRGEGKERKTFQQMGVAGEDVRKVMEGNMDSLARAKQILESTGEIDAATQLQTIYNGILDTNVKIYGLKGKELEQTMKIREGYLDVLDEMTTGAGIVAGLIPDMNRGIMSVMDVQRMMTGADFGGAMRTGFTSMRGFGQAGAAAFAPKYTPYGLMGFEQTPAMAMYTGMMERKTQEASQSRWQAGVDINRSSWGELGIQGPMGGSRLFPGAGKFEGGMLDSYKEGGKVGYLERFARTVGSYIMKARGKDPYDSTPTAINGVRGYNGGMFTSYKDGGLFGKSVIDLSAGGKLSGTPSPGIDDAFATFATGGALVGKGEFFVPSSKIKGGDLTNLNAINSRFAGNSTNGENSNTSLYNTSRNAASRSDMAFKLGPGFVMNRGGTVASEQGLNDLLAGNGGTLAAIAGGMNKNGGMFGMFEDGGVVAKFDAAVAKPIVAATGFFAQIYADIIDSANANEIYKHYDSVSAKKSAKKLAEKIKTEAEAAEKTEAKRKWLFAKNIELQERALRAGVWTSKGIEKTRSLEDKIPKDSKEFFVGTSDINKLIIKEIGMDKYNQMLTIPNREDLQREYIRQANEVLVGRERENYVRNAITTRSANVSKNSFSHDSSTYFSFSEQAKKEVEKYPFLTDKEKDIAYQTRLQEMMNDDEDKKRNSLNKQISSYSVNLLETPTAPSARDLQLQRRRGSSIPSYSGIDTGSVGGFSSRDLQLQRRRARRFDGGELKFYQSGGIIGSMGSRMGYANFETAYYDPKYETSDKEYREIQEKRKALERKKEKAKRKQWEKEEKELATFKKMKERRSTELFKIDDKEYRDFTNTHELVKDDRGEFMIDQEGNPISRLGASSNIESRFAEEERLLQASRERRGSSWNWGRKSGVTTESRSVQTPVQSSPNLGINTSMVRDSRIIDRGYGVVGGGQQVLNAERQRNIDMVARERKRIAKAEVTPGMVSGGELTAGSIAGLATLTRMANGGQTAQQQAATAAMYLGGGINVQRMYLNGKLMASDAKSQGNDQFFSKLKLQTTG